MSDSASQSICVLRLSALGDVSNAVAAVQAIQTRYPNCKITWISGQIEAQFLQMVPNIEVIPYNKKGGWQALMALKKALQGRRFDYLLHMQAALRASIVSLVIPAKTRIGFDRARARELQWLFTNSRVATAQTPHVLDGFMQFAAKLGCDDLHPHWQLNLPEEARSWARETLPKRTILICPGASKSYKNWHPQGYAAVIAHLQQKGFEPVLIGSPSPVEMDLAKAICQQITHPLLNLVGQTSLAQLCALIKQSPLLISPDTGPAHIAVALGTPVIGLYAHHNPERTGPYLYRSLIVSAYEEAIKAQTGKSAAELPWRSRVKDPQAMERIKPEQVIARIDELLLTLFPQGESHE